MKKFEIPEIYKSSIINSIKEKRKLDDPRKKDFSPTVLNFGPVIFYIARHFGFCYGVENAIEIAYKTLDDNPGKNIYLLSEMIHNPAVNRDLIDRGIKFILDTYGNQLIDWNLITSEDIVIVPAFGTTIEMENYLNNKGIDTKQYNTTCPFVEKVWNRASSLGEKDYTIIIHGKAKHEETRATFSHSVQNSNSVIVKDLKEAEILARIIKGDIPKEQFYKLFESKHSNNFDVDKHLVKVGVVNQTTMLATETQEIADLLRQTMIDKFGENVIKNHFADTRDTLCYATNDNQTATLSLLETDADFAIVVGGYNSSNTTHLVEILEKKFKTYFISGCDKIDGENSISHFEIHSKTEDRTNEFIPHKEQVKIAITSGASCPDSIVDNVMKTVLNFFPNKFELNEVLEKV